ncbi:DUF3604 domain-containing protein [Marinigracilibium pacificum]|uniref:DUF3604 domain-containing protein n=1 Tax=Marinigracilibium pacificum TaxID=2729599 RepID=A0A848IYB7_9BACT|nr:DUF3604 domain-containing protein [Marinigracilibium pacificum]NMM48275.1 DUF3604 domain-containing protein [Marinigracilibium pacificum]
MKTISYYLIVISLVFLGSCSGNQESEDTTESTENDIVEVEVKTNPLRDVYWGDQHVHTAWSADAGAAGTRIGPEEVLRFARGEEVISASQQKAKLARPLDWVAITDHSDGAGVINAVIEGDPEVMGDPIVAQYHEDMEAGGEKAAAVMMDLINRQSNGNLPDVFMDPEFAASVWLRNIEIVEEYNDPGTFTAFIAYEWTSNYGGGNNLHRNVIYRDNGDIASKMSPMTTFDSENPEDLWKWMANFEEKTGGHLLAIPHNGNLSNGLMFRTVAFDGSELTKELATLRNKYERLYETTQGKGTSEVHPSLAANDEFASFEIWDKGNLVMVPKEQEMLQYEYTRSALKNGLMLEDKLGVNPFKYGLASGTDTHTGLSTADENNFWGKYASSEPSPERWDEKALDFPSGYVLGWELGASGYTGVWAESNTREALWDAMHRRETYASTGPRMTVRFFGGFDYTEDDLDISNMVQNGYDKGVPMGGDLSNAPEGKAPVFMVYANKDPEGGNLDRIQIIKGWLNSNGKTEEKIFNVAWGDADSRNLDSNGNLPEVGNTVNVEKATWENSIGDSELKAIWTDPDFDPNQRAFYYVRVIQIPTPRWTAYDALNYDLEMTDDVPMSLQERAYTSPIWYTPSK